MTKRLFATAEQHAEPRPAAIRNTGPVGNDLVCSPLQIDVPLVLIWRGSDLHWCPEVMDLSAARRMVETINTNPDCFAAVVSVPLIVPAAGEVSGEVDAEAGEHEDLEADALRVKLRPGGAAEPRQANPFKPTTIQTAGASQ